MQNPKRFSLRLRYFLYGILCLIPVLAIWFLWRTHTPVPGGEEAAHMHGYHRVQAGPDDYRVGNNRLWKNRYGIWEMHLEGSPYERGAVYGVLAKELMEKQEEAFVGQIREMIPNSFWLYTLRYFIGWFNRDIHRHIAEENLKEIYGISRSFSDAYGFIGGKYQRILNYHAAHDIGHALVGMNMVGCTSFAVNKAYAADSSLLIGRNFDFNMGDRFAEDKMILFLKPDSGYAFASVSWAGFTGVVSGMNEKGLTVTLNAARSEVPFASKTPVSLLAREILQYASTIEEAVSIAHTRETFVSESLLIGSAADDKAVIIEKTPSQTDVFDSGESYLVCANHYQSPLLRNEAENLENIRMSDSGYRYDRMKQLLSAGHPVDPVRGAGILRNMLGLDDRFIGYGNAKSLNQLLAHHGVMFRPSDRTIWVSANPYQLGAFVGYDLRKVFSGRYSGPDSTAVIPADPFLETEDYRRFEAFKRTRQKIQRFLMTGAEPGLSEADLSAFIADNPESYMPYLYLGDYYREKGMAGRATEMYRKALQHDPASRQESEGIRRKIEGLK